MNKIVNVRLAIWYGSLKAIHSLLTFDSESLPYEIDLLREFGALKEIHPSGWGAGILRAWRYEEEGQKTILTMVADDDAQALPSAPTRYKLVSFGEGIAFSWQGVAERLLSQEELGDPYKYWPELYFSPSGARKLVEARGVGAALKILPEDQGEFRVKAAWQCQRAHAQRYPWSREVRWTAYLVERSLLTPTHTLGYPSD